MMTTNDHALETAAKMTLSAVFNLRHEGEEVCECCGRTFETRGALLADGRIVGIACAIKAVGAAAVESCGFLTALPQVLATGYAAPRAFDPATGTVVTLAVVAATGGGEQLQLGGVTIATRKRPGRWYQSEAELDAAEVALAAAAEERAAERRRILAERDAKRAEGVHVGTVGSRETFAAVVEFQGNIGTREFPRTLTVLSVTDSSGRTGQAVCWGKFDRVEKGAALRVTATVKAHGEYRGGASTVLTRCKLEA